MTRAMLEPGDVFAGRYKILRLLAPGGMGAVFEARHLGTERHVALKLLWPHVLAVESAREKFELEAKVAARVQSEHIVHVLDAGFDGDSRTPYLVMELLHGGTLAALVEGGGPQSHTFVTQLLEQVARGLDAAHGLRDEAGRPAPIIHRDLKPENLLLCTGPGDVPVIKILDFGIAKVLTESRNMSHEVRGTPLFMAYEQVVAGALSPQTDVWALGLIAYYLLTGRRYWKTAGDPNAGIQALFAEIVNLPIPPASVRMREQGVALTLPAPFDAWFARCLDRVPSRRFESAGAAVIALEAALRSAPSGSRRLVQTLSEPSAPSPAPATPRAKVEAAHASPRASDSWSGARGGSTSTFSVPAVEGRWLPGRTGGLGLSRTVILSGVGIGLLLLLGLGLLLQPTRKAPADLAAQTTSTLGLSVPPPRGASTAEASGNAPGRSPLSAPRPTSHSSESVGVRPVTEPSPDDDPRAANAPSAAGTALPEDLAGSLPQRNTGVDGDSPGANDPARSFAGAAVPSAVRRLPAAPSAGARPSAGAALPVRTTPAQATPTFTVPTVAMPTLPGSTPSAPAPARRAPPTEAPAPAPTRSPPKAAPGGEALNPFDIR